MFCTMFELRATYYIVEHIEFTKIIHREPPKRKEILPIFVQKYCSYKPLLILNSKTVKYKLSKTRDLHITTQELN